MAEAENPKKIIPEFIERAIKREIEIVIVEELEKAKKRIEERKSHVVAKQEDVYYNVCNDCGVLFLRRQDVE